MKQAKVILITIGILAIIGGALAFKASFNGIPTWMYKSIPLTTYSVTVGHKVCILITSRLCTTTTNFFTEKGIFTTTYTNGLPAVADCGTFTTSVPGIYTSCIEVPDTFTTNLN